MIFCRIVMLVTACLTLLSITGRDALAETEYSSSGEGEFFQALMSGDNEKAMSVLHAHPQLAENVGGLVAEKCNATLFKQILAEGKVGPKFAHFGLVSASRVDCNEIKQAALSAGAVLGTDAAAAQPIKVIADTTSTTRGSQPNQSVAPNCARQEHEARRRESEAHTECDFNARNVASLLASRDTSKCDYATQRSLDADDELESCQAGQTSSASSASAHNTSSARCATDLGYLRSSLVSELRDDPSISTPLDDSIRAAGGLDRAILLTRMQIDSDEKSLSGAQQSERATRASGAFVPSGDPVNDRSQSAHGSAAKSVRLIQDKLMLNRAALEAFNCRKHS